jgi:hypothetical protein
MGRPADSCITLPERFVKVVRSFAVVSQDVLLDRKLSISQKLRLGPHNSDTGVRIMCFDIPWGHRRAVYQRLPELQDLIDRFSEAFSTQVAETLGTDVFHIDFEYFQSFETVLILFDGCPSNGNSEGLKNASASEVDVLTL